MLPGSSAMVGPIRYAARHSAPGTAAYARAAASASTSATTSSITPISQTRSMSGAGSPVPALGRGLRIPNPLRGKKSPSARAAGPSTPGQCLWLTTIDALGLSGVSIPIRRAFSRSPLLSAQMVSPSATVVTQTATGRGQGCAAARPNNCDCGMLPGGRKGPPSSSAVPPCPLVSSERNWERRDG